MNNNRKIIAAAFAVCVFAMSGCSSDSSSVIIEETTAAKSDFTMPNGVVQPAGSDESQEKNETVLASETETEKETTVVSIVVPVDEQTEPAAVPAETSAEETVPAETSAEETIPAEQTPSIGSAHIGEVDSSYFDDVLMIGDSRTEGIRLYGTIKNCTYFDDVGMGIYDLWKTRVDVDGIGNVNLEELFSVRQFGKIYIMLGINELYADQDTSAQKFREAIEKIQTLQPDAYIVIQANLHLTVERSSTDPIYNNPSVDSYNQKIAAVADGKKVFYIDANPLFDDENGNMRSELSSDHTHMYAKYYPEWCEWLKNHAVVRE